MPTSPPMLSTCTHPWPPDVHLAETKNAVPSTTALVRTHVLCHDVTVVSIVPVQHTATATAEKHQRETMKTINKHKIHTQVYCVEKNRLHYSKNTATHNNSAK